MLWGGRQKIHGTLLGTWSVSRVAAAVSYGPGIQEEQTGTELGAGPSQAPLLIGLGRLLDGHIHGLLLCLQTPLKLLVDVVVGGLLKEEILNVLPELGIGGQHLVKVDSDLWGGCASNRVLGGCRGPVAAH